MDGPEDALTPRALHPIFFGSFDWHSCVHGYWLLLRVRRLLPGARRSAPRSTRLLDEMLTPANVAGELAYLDRAYRRAGFERPYGWAWLLALAPRGAAARGHELGRRAGAAGARLRRPLPRLPAQADLPDPRRHPFQHRLRADPRARLGRGQRSRPGRADRRPRARLLSAATRPVPAGSRAATISCRRR